jgi:hypothetical protein
MGKRRWTGTDMNPTRALWGVDSSGSAFLHRPQRLARPASSLSGGSIGDWSSPAVVPPSSD